MNNKQSKPISRPRSRLHTTCMAALALLSVGGAQLAHAAEAETDVMGPGNTQLEFKLGASRDVASGVRQLSPPLSGPHRLDGHA